MRWRHDQSMRFDSSSCDNQKAMLERSRRHLLREKQGQMRHPFVLIIHGSQLSQDVHVILEKKTLFNFFVLFFLK